MHNSESIREYIDYFKTANQVCADFGKTTEPFHFNNKEQSIEIFSLTGLKLIQYHTKSIFILLENRLYIECFIVSRSIIEIYYSLQWAMKGSRDEILEKVYRLEADPLSYVESETRKQKDALAKSTRTLNANLVDANINILREIKRDNPWLLTDSTNQNSGFKKAPAMPERMGMRLGYIITYIILPLCLHIQIHF